MPHERSAWLILNGNRLDLDDYKAGYAMTELNLGFPEVREVVNNRPVQHGIDDQTRYLAGREVTAAITAWPGGEVPLDDIVAGFAPYMNPAARPELHYTLISDDYRERVITLRAANFASAMPSPTRRDMQLAWVAPDPIIRDATLRTATAWSGSSTPAGRIYNLSFNRIYPPGSGAPVVAEIVSYGDVPVAPRLMLYGPITQPIIEMQSQVPEGPINVGKIAFLASFTVGAGQWVDIDCLRHSAYLNSDSQQSVINDIDFSGLTWPLIFPSPYVNWLSLTGTTTSAISQVQALWQDCYLS
jgi:hypothetical protein